MHSILRSVPLGFHLHLMARDIDGNPASAAIVAAEEDADRLAYELLAPAEHVIAGRETGNRRALKHKLQHFYGLPGIQASRYAELLLPRGHADPHLLRLKSLV
jgi:hypothetical protein